MPSANENYFLYLPETGVRGIYPAIATAAGFTQIPPGTPYPPQRHPLDHHFTWSAGRVLRAFQIVYITQGSGSFESGESSRSQSIEPGTLFVLFPGVWHRYAPDIKTGWTEHWIECRGPAFEKARKQGILRPDRPLLRVGMNRDLIDTFELCHRWARRASPARVGALSTLGLHLLAVLEGADFSSSPPSHVDLMVERVQNIILERFQERLDMRELAQSLAVGYSSLRQTFKARTGLSPKQFQLHIRLHRAKDLLADTDKSVKEIADLLGFDSPYHFSGQFKKRVGISPRKWREQLGTPMRRPLADE
jgi:AraC-like DNA-binding protein